MAQNQQPINISLKDTEELICKECGNNTFQQVMYLRKLSALLSPSGQDTLIPVAVFQCTKCHEILPETMPDLS